MRTATAFYRNSLALAAAAAVLAAIVLTPSPAPAQAVRASAITETNSIKDADFLLLSVVDASSGTGYRTRNIRWDTLRAVILGSLGSNDVQTITNWTTNYQIWASNVMGLDLYLSNLFQTNFLAPWTWQTITTNWQLYASNLVALDACTAAVIATNLSNTTLSNWFYSLLSTNANPGDLIASNILAWNAYVSDWFRTNADPCPSNFWKSQMVYATNWTENYTTNNFTNVINTIVSNWFYTNLWRTNADPVSLYASNIIDLDAYMSNWFKTNHWAPVTNLYYTTNLYTTNLTQIISNYFTYSTNFYTNVTYVLNRPTFISNFNYFTATNIIDASNVIGILTNFLHTRHVALKTNHWYGPSNIINWSWGMDHYYETTTSCAVTGLVSLPDDGYSASIQLNIWNAGSSNMTFYPPPGTRGTNGAWAPPLILLTNSETIIWFKVNKGVRTNMIMQTF
jgi:hypothetical protein